MLQQPRRTRSSVQRGAPHLAQQPQQGQRVFRSMHAPARRSHFWSGKLPLLIGLALLLLGYRIMRLYQYYQETTTKGKSHGAQQ
ncbi:hypothetical protein MVEG_11410 [Podila verticillata NRRL 6337]|uniref:Uncharacterized protein n=1 Tax=Podila verticillata NRRL 6337 TaxID=1069443 RepID=A0A086TLQ9_9FUNG|nr:hypothetical protein MVEG_11410 [Podila verticillata NRRL 6337]